jgi:4-hydroxymandelate oxidase
MGARAVQIGRPVVWGLVVDGENGVRDVLSLLRDALDLAMALAGCRSIDEIAADLLRPE